MTTSRLITVPVWRAQVKVYVSDQIEKICKKYYCQEFGRFTDAKFVWFNYGDNSKGDYAILIRPTATPGLVAHECLHATNTILEQKGVGLTSWTNDEAQAYLLQFLVDEVMPVLEKAKKWTPSCSKNLNSNESLKTAGSMKK